MTRHRWVSFDVDCLDQAALYRARLYAAEKEVIDDSGSVRIGHQVTQRLEERQ